MTSLPAVPYTPRLPPTTAAEAPTTWTWKRTELPPRAEAVTMKEPVVWLVVNAGAVARPAADMTAVAVRAGPGKVPLGPAAGAVKVTVPPCTGSSRLLAVTRTVKGTGKALLGGADWLS